MMSRTAGRLRSAVSLAAVTALAVAPVSAQSNLPASPSASATQPGWLITPSIGFTSGWDDNVFVAGRGAPTEGDVISSLNPQFSAAYNGRFSQFTADYGGAFLLYRQLTALNSFAQRASLAGRSRLSRHVTLFVTNAYSRTPTTENAELVGIPFVRTGSTIDGLDGGAEISLSKRTMLTIAGDGQWITFSQPASPTPETLATGLHGGTGFGGTATVKHHVSERTAIITDYRAQRATVSDTGERFLVQSLQAGIEQTISQELSVVAEAGAAHLQTNVGDHRTGPSYHAGVRWRPSPASFEADYGRSYIPSFGIGGTTQNEEATAALQLPLSRWFYERTSAAWRRNEPLTIGLPRLSSLWLETSLGYSRGGAFGFAVFFQGAHQTIDRPGGVVNDVRVGLQVSAGAPMRIR